MILKIIFTLYLTHPFTLLVPFSYKMGTSYSFPITIHIYLPLYLILFNFSYRASSELLLVPLFSLTPQLCRCLNLPPILFLSSLFIYSLTDARVRHPCTVGFVLFDTNMAVFHLLNEKFLLKLTFYQSTYQILQADRCMGDQI